MNLEFYQGMTLANGCVVIAARNLRDREFVILAMTTHTGTRDPYITWIGYQGVTVHGHYFSDIREAVKDYGERS